MSYTYSNDKGIILDSIKTSPSNIVLKSIHKNVVSSGLFGINGGFFSGSDAVSIAINNDIPACLANKVYGSGWFNEKYARGTLVWDKVARAFSIQVVSSGDEIKVTDRHQYWAQGGISMSLQDDAHWKAIADAQHMPNIIGATQRVAMVYNSSLNVWLVLSEGACTAQQFRSAIKAQIGSGTLVDGIFLDGGGSAQMNCTENKFSGDGRSVVQMVSLLAK
jgi:hypothetical protein